MAARIAADAVMIVHLAFVLFVVLGGLLAVRDLRFAWLHLPAAAWGAYVEFAARVCPLTPLENRLRRAAGEAGYEGGFIAHYVTPVIYPAGLTSAHQFWIGVVVVAFNLLVYFVAVSRWRRLNG
jgi:hypothetical protein